MKLNKTEINIFEKSIIYGFIYISLFYYSKSLKNKFLYYALLNFSYIIVGIGVTFAIIIFLFYFYKLKTKNDDEEN